MLVQALDYKEIGRNPFLKNLGIRLQWSMYQSLQALTQESQVNLKNLEIARNFLDLFSTLLSTHPHTFSDNEIIDMLGNCIIPLLDFYLVETKDLFTENVQECLA